MLITRFCFLGLLIDDRSNEDAGFWEADNDKVLEQSVHLTHGMIDSTIQISPSPPESFIMISKEDLLSCSSISQTSDGKSDVPDNSGTVSVPEKYSPTDAVIIGAGLGETIPQSQPYPEQVEMVSADHEPEITKRTEEGGVELQQDVVTTEETRNENDDNKTIDHNNPTYQTCQRNNDDQ